MTVGSSRQRGLLQLDLSQLPGLILGGQVIRTEEYADADSYVVRAEAPGIDPAKDVQIVAANGRLQIKVERTEERVEKAHSEFHYGSFARSVVLPPGADEDAITAKYENGILEIRVPVRPTVPSGREIRVETVAAATG